MRRWLIEIRKEKGMSQYNVAEKCGISQSYYAAIEIGERGKPLSVNTAKKIAAVLGFDWTRFYDKDPGEGAEEETARKRMAKRAEEIYSGQKTINQARKELGLEPIEKGDQKIIAESYIPKGMESRLKQNQ